MLHNSARLLLPSTYFLLFAAALSPVRADFKEDIDFNRLQNEYGGALPTGAGVRVVQVEYVRDGAWAPNTGGELSGKSLVYRTGFFGGISDHANNVARYLLGNGTSITPGVTGWGAFEATSFTGRGSLNGGRSVAPVSADWDVENHSWGGSDAIWGLNILDKADYRIDRDNVISLAGVDNYASSRMSMFMGNFYNGISVGNSTGDHASTTTLAVSGRLKPDLVGTRNFTSYATPIVASCATLLLGEIQRTPALSAARASMGIKAILLAGATKEEFPDWDHSPSRPLDVIYGAGEVNIYNSYKILTSGQQSGNVSPTGWDVATSSGTRYYFFTVPAGQTGTFSAVLAWNRHLNPDAIWLNLSPWLTNLNLSLWSADGNFNLTSRLEESSSAVDNVEHVYRIGLPAGNYALEVSGPGGEKYGLAWRCNVSGSAPPPPPPPPPLPPPPAPPPSTPWGAFGDSGFEAVSVGANIFSAFQYRPGGSNWSFEGDAGVAGNGSGFTLGNPAAPDGTQVAFIQRQGAMTQTVSLSAGTYQISAQIAQRALWQAQDQTVLVYVDGSEVGTFKASSGGYATAATGAFSVSDGQHTVRLVGTAGGDGTLLLDGISLSAAAPPAPPPPPPPPPPVPSSGFAEASFEGVWVGSNDFSAFRYTPSIAGWSFNGYAGIAGNNSGFTASNPGAPSGSQVAFLQMQGSMSQTVYLSAGSYQISALVAQRGNYQAQSQTVAVYVDDQQIGSLTAPGSGYQSATTAAFSVGSGNHTIRFSGTAWADGTLLLDDLSLNAAGGGGGNGGDVWIAGAGFESPQVGTNDFDAYRYNPSGDGWSFGGSSGVAGNNSGFTLANPNAPGGSQVAFVQRNDSIVAQDIVFPSSGTYIVSVAAAQRGIWNQQNQIVNVYIDENYVGSIDPWGSSYQSYTFPFSVSAGSHRLSFRGTAGQDGTVFLDEVRLRKQ